MLDACDPSTIITGGESDRDDLFIAPTIVSPVDPYNHPLMQQEIFGPILPIIPIDNIDEGIKIVNSKPYPLALYVFASSKYNYDHSKS